MEFLTGTPALAHSSSDAVELLMPWADFAARMRAPRVVSSTAAWQKGPIHLGALFVRAGASSAHSAR